MILLIGIGARLWMFGEVPGGINQDEAFAAREAWSLLMSGKDSFGYPYPMYLTTWGSGMNALNTYLMMPFIALFGMHTWVFRIPQVLIGILSILTVEEIVSEIADDRLSLVAMFVFAISPWHIMLSRWALESNLAVGFLLFGLLFFIYGIRKQQYFILSAVFYGLSLYCYAAIWPVVPFLILLQGVYLLYVRKVRITGYIVISVLVFLLFATPVILFYLVNMGIISEIVTPCFSIPRLVEFRNSEFSIRDIPGKLKILFHLLLTENDGEYWNSTDKFGLYYKYGLVFTLTGFAVCLKETWKSLRKRKYHGYVLVLIQFLAAVALGALIHVNVTRINCIFAPVLLLMAIGIDQFIQLFRQKFHHVGAVVITLYLLAFLSFEHFYFTEYEENISQYFKKGIEPAVHYAEELSGGERQISIGNDFLYPQILVFSELSPEEYRNTVEYTNYPSKFLDISKCGNYVFHRVPDGEAGIYILYGLSESDMELYKDMGYRVTGFDTVSVIDK